MTFPPDHPIWHTLHLAVTAVILTFSITLGASIVLYVTATNFDSTELTAIGGIGATSMGVVSAFLVLVRKYL